jgi:dTDP-4-dehydrorhamnose reductase
MRPQLLLTGANGQVGWALRSLLAPLGDVHAQTHANLDLTDIDALRACVRSIRPQIIINAAAYTAVDRAEQEEHRARAVNTLAPAVLAEESRQLGAWFVHLSTDYVFDGQKGQPYVEDDITAPLSAYGRSKRDGDDAIVSVGGHHVILRTGWIFGLHGQNFLRTMQRLGSERASVSVVDDQWGSPTWSRLLAQVIALLVARRCAGQDCGEGIYHCVATGHTSWYGFAQAIMTACGLPCTVYPIATSQYPTPAHRPRDSRLCCHRLAADYALSLPSWSDQLTMCLSQQP